MNEWYWHEWTLKSIKPWYAVYLNVYISYYNNNIDHFKIHIHTTCILCVGDITTINVTAAELPIKKSYLFFFLLLNVVNRVWGKRSIEICFRLSVYRRSGWWHIYCKSNSKIENKWCMRQLYDANYTPDVVKKNELSCSGCYFLEKK